MADFLVPYNGTAEDQAMTAHYQKCAETVKGEVRSLFNQVAGRKAQRLRRIRCYPVSTMASRWEGKGNRWRSGNQCTGCKGED